MRMTPMQSALVVVVATGLSVAHFAAGQGQHLPPGPPPPSQDEAKALPPGAEPGWWSQVQRQIQEEEYHLSWSDDSPTPGARGVWQALNRAQGFRTRFTEGGIRVVSAAESGPAWQWGLELVAWGRPSATQPIAAAPLVVSAGRAEYRRGPLTEWYINDERGLEQGFTLSAPPAESGVRSEESGGIAPHASPLTPHGLWIDLALSGNLRPKFAEDGQAVYFYASGNHMAVLRYAGLKVTDATGRVLPARFEGLAQFADDGGRPTADGGTNSTLVPRPSSASGGIRIVVDDAGALYPITVDPLTTSPAWLAVGEVSLTGWGSSLATAGDVNGDGYSDVVVGAYGFNSNTGKAYLYLGGPSGLSTAPYWTAMGTNSSYFGFSVATAGDVNGDGYSDVVVGSYGYFNNQGTARLYLGGASGLSPTNSWNPWWGSAGDLCGISVGTAGDVNGDGYSDILVGASGYSGSTGRAYLYLGGSSGLSATPSWTATGEAGGSAFGYQVATAGDVNGDGYSDVVVGAYAFSGSTGKAYLYLSGPSGPEATASWTATGEAGSNYFGFRVGTAGDVNGDGRSDIVVGAYGYNGSTGKAYLYLGGPSGLSATASWTAAGEVGSDSFGYSAATAGDINGDGFSDVVVGAYRNNTQMGKAYLYLGGLSGLSASASWTTVGEATSNYFGYCVATAGDANGDGYSDVVVTAPANSSSRGKGYLYFGSAGGLSDAHTSTTAGENASDAFGSSVASAGDVNGDGYSDVVVGAFGSSANSGKAYLYLGGALGVSITPSWTAVGEEASNYFGRAVASAGDVNGDGYSDVVISAFGFSGSTGKVYLYLGGPSGLSATASWSALGEGVGSEFGSSVAGGGDVNGDGYADVVVGAQGFGGFTGKSCLYLGGPSGLSAAPNWTAVGESTNHAFGHSVTTAGDVNRDGYYDVIVGADGYASDTGKVYLYLGGAAGLSATPSWSTLGETAADHFGLCVAMAGDVNGDGYSDALIGAPQRSNSTGKVYLYLGGAAGLSATSAWTATGEGAGDGLGAAASGAGDVNGDGYSDVVVGATGNTSSTGRAYLYLGSASGLGGTAAWAAAGEAVSDSFGGAVATAGDMTGDGYSDVIVGAYGVNGDAGRVYLYFGAGGPGVTVTPRQLRAEVATPIAQGGRAADGLFRAALTGRTPFGRGSVKLEWQISPLGGTFSPMVNPIQAEPSWSDSGLTGAPLQRLALLQARSWPWFLPQDEGPYVWRARTKYRLSTTPFQSHGPWFTIASNGLMEADLRRLPACILPTSACSVTAVTKQGAACTMSWQDFNQTEQRTGWNIRRSSTASTPKTGWVAIGQNVQDQDPGTADIQWTDGTGDIPSTGIYFYQVTAYNASCPAEGPF